MRFRERHDDERQRPDPQPENSGGANLARLRLAGEGLLAAGAAAINRTLSGNSEAFVNATRQQGGQ
jgi:hypothetical protein